MVPTIYEYFGKDEIVNTNQYSVTDYKRDLDGGWDERGKVRVFVSFYAVLYRFVQFLYRFMLFLYRFILFLC